MKAIKKIALYIGLFLIFFIASLFTKLPAYFDSYVFYEDYKFAAHVWLVIYRVLIYVAFPLCVSLFDKIKFKGVKYFHLLIENFNLQFCAYSIISGIYVVFGLDKVLGVAPFGVSEVFVFVTGFVFTIMLEKQIPNLVYSNKPEWHNGGLKYAKITRPFMK